MKRYEPKVLQTAQHDAWAEMVKDPDGEWVRAEELEELRAERDSLREKLKWLNDFQNFNQLQWTLRAEWGQACFVDVSEVIGRAIENGTFGEKKRGGRA